MVIHHFNRIIRNKWVWGVFAILISMFFAFDFIFDRRGDAPGSDGAGTLGGDKVSPVEFNDVRADIVAEMILLTGREPPVRATELNKMVWERLVLLKVARDMSITVTDEDVQLVKVNMFKDEAGAFNAPLYQAMCQRLGWQPDRFEAFFRRHIILQRILNVVESFWMPPLQISGRVRDMTDKITVRVARFQHKNAASIKLDDAAFKAYYESHTNSFALPALTAIRYVKVPVKDVKTTFTDAEIRGHFEDTIDLYGTNAFETVKAQVEGDLRREKMRTAAEEATGPLYNRVCPNAPDPAVDQLAKLAKEEKLEIKTSRPFTLTDGDFMESRIHGFMVDAASVLPDCSTKDLVAMVSDIDPAEPSSRYRAIAGTNAVYVIGLATNLCSQPRVLAYEEITNNASIRQEALADLKAQDFKKSVDKVREAVLADLKKTSKLDPKLFGDANVSTSITFVAQTAGYDSFPDVFTVVPAAMQLAKGELSEFQPTMPDHGLVVYVEDRQPGEGAASMRAQIKANILRSLGEGDKGFAVRRMYAIERNPRDGSISIHGLLPHVQPWVEANMARLGVQPSERTAMERTTDDADDGEGSQE